MKKIKLGNTEVSVISVGCMRIPNLEQKELENLINTALELGINHFDHADIYGGGNSESLFGEVLSKNSSLRDKIIIETKCGIRKGFYDMSYEHIIEAVNDSLSRLKTEYIDTLLFHRPDILAEADELARAIEELKKQGKVRSFGVSNMNSAQLDLLSAWTGEKFITNQLQLSLMHCDIVTSLLNVNVTNDEGIMRDGSIIPYCQKNDIGIQAWSPLQYGMFKGCFIDNEKFPSLNKELDTLAKKYGVSKSAIAVSWILRLPLKMQVVVGTTSAEHLKEICGADEVTLTKPEWYGLYRSCGYMLP